MGGFSWFPFSPIHQVIEVGEDSPNDRRPRYEPFHHLVEGCVRFAKTAHSHADSAVCAHMAPVLVAGLSIKLPLRARYIVYLEG